MQGGETVWRGGWGSLGPRAASSLMRVNRRREKPGQLGGCGAVLLARGWPGPSSRGRAPGPLRSGRWPHASTHQLSRDSTSGRKPPCLVTMPPRQTVDPQGVRKRGASHPQGWWGREAPISPGLKQQTSEQGCPWVSSRAEEKAQHPPGPSLSSGPKWRCPALDTLSKHLLHKLPRFAQDSKQPWEQSLSLNI